MRPFRRTFVPDHCAGMRIDVFLSLRYSDWSRSKIAKAIQEGQVESELRSLKPSTTLHAGEILKVYIPGIAPEGAPPPLPPVLYEDDSLIILNKPPGMLAHPSGQRWEYAVIGLVREARPSISPDLAHRLDRETSGILVLTKSSAANHHMKEVFKGRRASKTYLALVHGTIPWEEETADGPIGQKPIRKLELRRAVVENGDPSRTRFTVQKRLGAHTLVACQPVTGRTHQIRVHLESVGFPILGDKIYGQPDDVFLEYITLGATPLVRAAVGFPRQCLHAHRLAFPHPVSGEILEVVAPLPEDMQRVVDGEMPTWPLEQEAPEAVVEEEG